MRAGLPAVLCLGLLACSTASKKSASWSPAVKHADSLKSESIQSAAGNFTIEITPSGKAALDAIHRERRVFYSRKNKGMDFMRKDDERLRGEDPRVSLFLRIDEKGELLGAFKKSRPGSTHHHEIWTYSLNEEGGVRKIVVSGGKLGDQEGAVASSYDGAGKFLGLVSVTPYDSQSVSVK
ncbi:MAG: hypothetical protein V3S11_02640 [Elusimicrobiota bacterium]